MTSPLLRATALVVGTAAALFSASASATPAWTVQFTPTQVYGGYADKAVYLGGATFESLPADFWATDGSCQLRAGKPANVGVLRFTQDPQSTLSIGLGAMLSGKTLSCMVDGTCYNGHPVALQCSLNR